MQIRSRSYIILIAFSLLLLGAFFLPWVRWESSAISGYALPAGDFFAISAEKFGLDNPFPGLDWLLKLFWAIPAGALLLIVLSVMKKQTGAAALVAGVATLSLATVFILFTRTLLMLGVGTSIVSALQPGLYISVVSALVILVFGIRAPLPVRILLVFAGPLAAWTGFQIIEKKTANAEYEDSANVKSAYTVWSQDLIREFRLNDSAANARYQDQILTVKGRISETELPNDSTVNIKMYDSTGSYAIFPFTGEYAARAKRLQPGDSVVIRASCSGGMYSEILETETITFKRCALIQ